MRAAAGGGSACLGRPGRRCRGRVRGALRVAGVVVTAVVAACSPGPAPGDPAGAAPAPGGERWDYLFVGGRLVDGTGNPWQYAEVAVAGDRVAGVFRPGRADRDRAREVVDITGMVLAPGFVDINGQGDTGLLSDGRALNKLHMGVTTELMGESNTPAPVPPGATTADPDADSVTLRRAREWTRFGAWLEEMEAGGVSVNVGSFIGGSTVRRYAMGMRDGRPTAAELDTMLAVTRRAMEDGALGLATALIYPPGAWAGTDELAILAREVARYGGLYISHIRSESDRLLPALEEVVEIGRRSGAPVEVYHLKAAGRDNWALQPQAVALIDRARRQGVDIQAAMYPYTAASTSLQACLPPWASEDGLLRENLVSAEVRPRLLAAVSEPGDGWENWCALSGPEGAMIVAVSRPENRHLVGRTVLELAELRRLPWPEAVVELLVEEGNVGMVYFAMAEENVRELLRQPWMKFGSDAGVFDPERAGGMTHPRAYGTYPRILGRYVRLEGVLPLEEAVRKMTWAVTSRVGLTDRGLVRAGFLADLVVFRPEAIREMATFTEPHQLAWGVEHVLVNGRPVLRDGSYTGALPGRFLPGPGALPRR